MRVLPRLTKFQRQFLTIAVMNQDVTILTKKELWDEFKLRLSFNLKATLQHPAAMCFYSMHGDKI